MDAHLNPVGCFNLSSYGQESLVKSHDLTAQSREQSPEKTEISLKHAQVAQDMAVGNFLSKVRFTLLSL